MEAVMRMVVEYMRNCLELAGLLMIWGVILLVIVGVVEFAWGVVAG